MFARRDHVKGRAALSGRFKSRGPSLAALALALGFGLGGCGSGDTVGETLGYEQKGPDEMAVIKRPPLVVPPDYNLRPPRPGDQAEKGQAASDEARKTLLGPSSSLQGNGSPENGSAKAADAEASPADQARATLTGAAPAPAATKAALAEDDPQRYQKSPPLLPKKDETETAAVEAPSAGQTALISRSNRVETDLDALNGTRAENRVDSALLRRLLAWQPPVPADADAGTDDDRNDAAVVQVIRREQVSVGAAPSLE